MAASASALRKTARSAGGSRDAGKVPQSVVELGWVATPHMYWKLYRCMTPLPFALLGILHDKTTGGFGAPEWQEIEIAELEDLTGGTRTAVTKALAVLKGDGPDPEYGGPQPGKGLIESRPRGKGREYRVLYKNWVDCPLRVVPAGEEEAEEDEAAEDEAENSKESVPAKHQFRLSAKKSHAVKLRLSVDRVVFRSDIEGEIKGRVLNNGTYCVEHKAKVVPIKHVPSRAHEDKAKSGGDRVDMTSPKSSPKHLRAAAADDPHATLRAELEPLFMGLHHKPLDDGLLQKIAAKLGDAPAVHLLRLVERRKPERSGLWVNLAEESHKAWQRMAKPKVSNDTEPASRFESEPEDSGSVWMQIRLAMKVKLSDAEYGNWFLRTRLLHKCSPGTKFLAVAVADEITLQFLTEEYGDQIRAVIKSLGLPIVDVVYRVVAS